MNSMRSLNELDFFLSHPEDRKIVHKRVFSTPNELYNRVKVANQKEQFIIEIKSDPSFQNVGYMLNMVNLDKDLNYIGCSFNELFLNTQSNAKDLKKNGKDNKSNKALKLPKIRDNLSYKLNKRQSFDSSVSIFDNLTQKGIPSSANDHLFTKEKFINSFYSNNEFQNSTLGIVYKYNPKFIKAQQIIGFCEFENASFKSKTLFLHKLYISKVFRNSSDNEIIHKKVINALISQRPNIQKVIMKVLQKNEKYKLLLVKLGFRLLKSAKVEGLDIDILLLKVG